MRLPKTDQIKDFDAVVKAGSFNAACRKTGRSQPALSRSIKELEETLGVQLLVRGARGVTLTPAGVRFSEYAASIIREIGHAVEETAALAGKSERSVVFAVPALITRTIFNAATQHLMKSEPRCQICADVATATAAAERMQRGLDDFAIGTLSEFQEMRGFVLEPFMECVYAVACAPDHPLAGSTRIEQIRNADWLYSSDFEACLQLRPELKTIEPAHKIVSNGYFVANQMIARNHFMAVLSAVQIRRHRRYINTVQLEGFPVRVPYVLAYPQDRPRTRLTERLMGYLKREAQAYDWESFALPEGYVDEAFLSTV